MNDYKDIKFQEEDGIGFISLNRPEKRNALSKNLMAEMIDLLKAVKSNPPGGRVGILIRP
jgi:enoyl-CoA hydratase/carnithine racemase